MSYKLTRPGSENFDQPSHVSIGGTEVLISLELLHLEPACPLNYPIYFISSSATRFSAACLALHLRSKTIQI